MLRNLNCRSKKGYKELIVASRPKGVSILGNPHPFPSVLSGGQYLRECQVWEAWGIVIFDLFNPGGGVTMFRFIRMQCDQGDREFPYRFCKVIHCEYEEKMSFFHCFSDRI